MFCHATHLPHRSKIIHPSDIYEPKDVSMEILNPSFSISDNLTSVEVNVGVEFTPLNPSLMFSNPVSESSAEVIFATEGTKKRIDLSSGDNAGSENMQRPKIELIRRCIPPQSTIFTTEGHIIILTSSLRARTSRKEPSTLLNRRPFVYDICPAM